MNTKARVLLVFLLAVCMAAIPAMAAPKPDLSGEWKLNVSKSDFGLLWPPFSRMDIEHRDPDLKIQRVQTNPQGKSRIEITCTTDGKECSVKGRNAGFKLKTNARWDGDVLLFDTTGTFNDNEVKIRERWTLGEDGKAITVERQLSSAQGETAQKLVLEKQ